ncbi:CBS domain-containing protein [Candidatus Poseidoniales archaeon]|nr:CBS domain-containing protein [Candidatus Poseidoniales archaeon]
MASLNRRKTSNSVRKQSGKNRLDVRRLTCEEVMQKPRAVRSTASMADVLEAMTMKELDHLFIVNRDGVPMGRIHAIDVLKLISRKTVNRSIAWMHGIEAKQLVNIPVNQIRFKYDPTDGAKERRSQVDQAILCPACGVALGIPSQRPIKVTCPQCLHEEALFQ